MNEDFKRELEDYKDSVESQLNLMFSTPLAGGGEFPMLTQQVDRITFLEDQMEMAQDLLDIMNYEDDKFLEDFYGK